MKLAIFSLVELRAVFFSKLKFKNQRAGPFFWNSAAKKKLNGPLLALKRGRGREGLWCLVTLATIVLSCLFFFEFWGKSLVWLKPVETAHPLPLPRSSRKCLMGVSVLLTSENPKPTRGHDNAAIFWTCEEPWSLPTTHRPLQAQTDNHFPSFQSPFPTPQTTDQTSPGHGFSPEAPLPCLPDSWIKPFYRNHPLRQDLSLNWEQRLA